jgi:transposase
MGRTKGALNTKIHAVVNARSQALMVALSSGNEADVSLAKELTEYLPPGSIVIADKAYDSCPFREAAATNGIKTSIPGRSNRTTGVPFSAKLTGAATESWIYSKKIKRYRRVASRYDKLAETLLGFVCLAVLLTLTKRWFTNTP